MVIVILNVRLIFKWEILGVRDGIIKFLIDINEDIDKFEISNLLGILFIGSWI